MMNHTARTLKDVSKLINLRKFLWINANGVQHKFGIWNSILMNLSTNKFLWWRMRRSLFQKTHNQYHYKYLKNTDEIPCQHKQRQKRQIPWYCIKLRLLQLPNSAMPRQKNLSNNSTKITQSKIIEHREIFK